MSEIKNIRDQFASKLKNDLSIDQINEIKTELFGKNGLISSKFINGLNKCGIAIDRKILAEIAYDSPEAFKTIVQKAQSALN